MAPEALIKHAKPQFSLSARLIAWLVVGIPQPRCEGSPCWRAVKLSLKGDLRNLPRRRNGPYWQCDAGDRRTDQARHRWLVILGPSSTSSTSSTCPMNIWNHWGAWWLLHIRGSKAEPHLNQCKLASRPKINSNALDTPTAVIIWVSLCRSFTSAKHKMQRMLAQNNGKNHSKPRS